MSDPKITLHTYFRSSASARVRIAMNIKGLPYDPKYIHLLKNEHTSPEYKAINPLGAVPTITFSQDGSDEEDFRLTQSIAILEYLEEAYPAPEYPSLLPTSPKDRARVRQLCQIMACDIQPHTNLKVFKRVKELIKATGQDPEVAGPQWQKTLMTEGFAALEAIMKTTAGTYSVGDQLTMADCCLAPTIDAGMRFGVDMGQFESIQRVQANLEKVDAVVKGGWRMQGDTPEEFRVKG